MREYAVITMQPCMKLTLLEICHFCHVLVPFFFLFFLNRQKKFSLETNASQPEVPKTLLLPSQVIIPPPKKKVVTVSMVCNYNMKGIRTVELLFLPKNHILMVLMAAHVHGF